MKMKPMQRDVQTGGRYMVRINRNGSSDLFRDGTYGRSAANPEHELAYRIVELEDRLKALGHPVAEAQYPD